MKTTYLEHGSSQHMTSVVSLDLQFTVHLDHLVQVDRHHLLHAVLDVAAGEEVLLPLPVHRHLPHVLQQDGGDGLGGDSHVDGTIVSHHLSHVGESSAVVEVEVRDDDCINVFCERFICGDVGEIRKPEIDIINYNQLNWSWDKTPGTKD